MSKKIARILQGKELLLGNQVIEYPAELEGGRNLIKKSNNFEGYRRYKGAIATFETGIQVKEWGATDATLISTSGGERDTKIYTDILRPSENGQVYTNSVWIKNVSDIPLKVAMNLGVFDIVKPYESKRVVITGIGNGGSHLQIQFKTLSDDIDKGLKFIAWRAKSEKGSKATPWTPAPEDLGLYYTDNIQQFRFGIDDSGTLLVPEIMEYPEELTGGNLISEREPKEITANSNDWKYIKIYYGLKKNTTYTFSSDVEVLKGDVKEIHIYPYLVSGKNMALIKVPIIDGKIIATFTTDDRYNYNLLVYAGLAGSTNGNSIRLTNYRLVEGSIGDEWGRNLIEVSDISKNSPDVTMDLDSYISDGIITMSTETAYGGIRINARKLQPNTTYTFSYRYKKLSGILKSFGGHTDPTWNDNVTYIDGKKSLSYASQMSAFVADDDKIHDVICYITTPDTIKQSDLIYIQPNRGYVDFVEIVVYDWKLEKGSKATPWTPAPEDLGLNYPNDIQSFGFNIKDSSLVTSEFIEGYPLVKPVIDDSLVLWLDGTTGNNYEQTKTWTDLSGNGNHGSLKNFAYNRGSGWTDGRLIFDGIDDYIESPLLDCIDKGHDYTFETIVSTLDRDGALYQKQPDARNRNGAFIQYGDVIVGHYDGKWHGAKTSEPINDGTEKHIVITKQGNNYDIFINGIKKSVVFSPYFNATWQLRIGNINLAGMSIAERKKRYLKGDMSLVRIYNRALTDEEVMQNYKAGQCSPLLAKGGI